MNDYVVLFVKRCIKNEVWEMKAVVSISLVCALGVSGISGIVERATPAFAERSSIVVMMSDLERGADYQNGDKVVSESEDGFVIAHAQKPTLLGGSPLDLVGKHELIPAAIGDTNPNFPGGRVCGESYIYKKDAEKLLRDTYKVDIVTHAEAVSVPLVIGAILKNGLSGIASALMIGIGFVKSKTEAWWAEQLLDVATGKKHYIRKQVICNYGGGYPAAWTAVNVG
ncbi:hypothetical protein [Trueperella sp. LYQ143]|uniref:hypothetical protein n=1 Tax=Trueperella sp. LYQ143 TaxID=3391059 RepID=UPI003982F136